MRSFADTWLILVVLALGGLVAWSGTRQTWVSSSTRLGREDGAASSHGVGPRPRMTPLYWVLVLSVWGAITLAAAVLGWAASPGEVRALALGAMLTAVVSRLVVTVLFIAPIVLSEQRLAIGAVLSTKDFHRRWQLRRTFLDGIALIATTVALVLTVSG